MFAAFSSQRIGVAFTKQWINKTVIQNCSRVEYKRKLIDLMDPKYEDILIDYSKTRLP